MKRENIENELKILKEKNNYRILKNHSKNLINFSSNDYLGIANDLNLKNEFYSKFSPKLSSSSSRLIDGSYEEVLLLEEEVEKLYKKPCILFNSGFDANSSIIETFCGKNSLILTDRLNHASIYDGIINSGATFYRYKHLDMESLEALLIKYKDKFEDILVVTESVYSMDGDMVDLNKLIDLKKKYGFDLMLDEAHSYGVFGYGIAYNLNLIKNIDFLIIPLGKGGGSVGSMVICDQLFKNYIINKSRKFIFSTALPPVNNAWNLFILKKMPTFEEKRKKLSKLVDYTLNNLKNNGITTISTTHIISIIIGDNQKAITIAENMKNKGFLLYAVKEPTVPKGTARFRIGLNPNITFENIDCFIKELKNELNTIF